MSDPSIALILLAPLASGYGTYITMEAVANESCVWGLIGSLVSFFGGIGIGKLLWGGVLW